MSERNTTKVVGTGGAIVLSIGGTAAALVQALGHPREAGAVMLVANVIVITAAIVGLVRARRGR